MTIVYTLIAATVTVLTVLFLLYVGATSGPNCPGMPPSWLGFCEVSVDAEG